MWELLIVVFIAFFIFLIFGAMMAMRKRSEDKPAVYLCSDCGEQDCLCHKEEHTA